MWEVTESSTRITWGGEAVSGTLTPNPALFLVRTCGIYQERKDSHGHQGAVKCVRHIRLVTRTVRLVTVLLEQQALFCASYCELAKEVKGSTTVLQLCLCMS